MAAERTLPEDASFVFVCYSHVDASHVHADVEWLKANGVNAWYDSGISAGSVWRTEVGERLEAASAVLFYISEQSVGSQHCNREINLAIDENKLIIPIYLADVVLSPDLKVGLGRLHALYRHKDEDYRQKLLTVWRWLPGAESARDPVAKGVPLKIPDKPSIVVLPFDNMSADPDQDHIADGVVEAITAELSRIRSFFVIARNSAFAYKGRSKNVRQIGTELGVAYLLEGSIQRAGERIRITVQLIEIDAGAHVWAERYDGTMSDIFDLQDRITEQVAGAMQPSIRIAEIERSRRKRPQDLGAYDYAMRAMPHVWAFEKGESDKALELLDKALAIDPSYPLALSLAGWCYAQRSIYNWAEDIAHSQAQALKLAEKAAELSGDDPLILSVLGAVHTIIRNHGTARIMLERAVAIDPNSAWAWSRLGWLENYADRPERGLEHFQKALRLSPLDPMNFNNYVGMAAAHEVAERYDESAALYRRALEERPHADWIYRNLASSLSGAGRMDEATEVFARLMRSFPDLTISKVRHAIVFTDRSLDRMCANLKRLGLPD